MRVHQPLGVIYAQSVLDTPPVAPELESMDVAFLKDIAQIVHDMLQRAYVSFPDFARAEAAKRGMTREQLLSSSIAYQVMRKVDQEYV